jgi:serine/threonine-protein kinase
MNEREIFIQALPIADPSEQAAFLDRACGPDQPLRQQVADLLAAHARAQSFLEVPPSAIAREPGPTTAGTAAERPGTQIGPYKLLEQIGEGGMGTVFVAQQSEPLKRLVALKIIKAGMDSRQVIARFEAERQALALMDHPNIAKVLDAGTTAAGRPYFVMELVKGVPITQYCDQHHLPPKERLELFVPVCQAIQHAHQKGIIHRDLKPSNVYLASIGATVVPKLLDFGAARTAVGEKTRNLTQVLTPGYAPFEQYHAKGKQGAWTDVYACAATLYHMLTGRKPTAAPDRYESDSLESPRDLVPELSPAISRAVMDGLALDRQRRPQSAAAFRKVLNDEVKDDAAKRPTAVAPPPEVSDPETGAPTEALPRRGVLQRLSDVFTGKRPL